MIVAIDGPAGSGKSTTARLVAERLGWLYVDTGAMYRAVGLALVGTDLSDDSAVANCLNAEADLTVEPDADVGMRVFLNRIDVTDRLRTPEAARVASQVSSLAPVRERLLTLQREVADRHARQLGGAVLEGRDIGTVVFPHAEVKVFMIAGLDARARRRLRELDEQLASGAPSFEEVRDELAERDQRDEARALAPLKPADDAIPLDTSEMSIEAQVEAVLDLVFQRQKQSKQ